MAIPALPQNSFQQITSTLTLPARPAGFPADGGRIFLALEGDANNNVYQLALGHPISKPIPVEIEAPLPQLDVVGLDVPPVMQPGDTIQANVRITNIGPGDTAPQGVVQVALVASTTRTFTSGSSIVSLVNLADPNTGAAFNIPGISSIATKGRLLGDANQTPPNNVITISFPVVTLPTSPKKYFLGVVVDPNKTLKQLSGVPQGGSKVTPLALVQSVGPPIKHLPPAGVLVNGGVGANVPTFPIPFNGVPVGGPVGGAFPGGRLDDADRQRNRFPVPIPSPSPAHSRAPGPAFRSHGPARPASLAPGRRRPSPLGTRADSGVLYFPVRPREDLRPPGLSLRGFGSG